MTKVQNPKEGAEVLKSLVKSGSLQIDMLKTAAQVGKESKIALRMLETEGFKG